MTPVTKFWSRVVPVLELWILLAFSTLAPLPMLGYDGHDRANVAYDGSQESVIGYDAGFTFSTGERKSGATEDRILFASFAEFLAAKSGGSEIVSLWKGPAKFNDVGGKLIPRDPASEVITGFDPAMYPGKGPFFGIGEAGKQEALTWANYYKNGFQEIQMPKTAFDDLVSKGIIKSDGLYDLGVAIHVPPEGLPSFNGSISDGKYLPPGKH